MLLQDTRLPGYASLVAVGALLLIAGLILAWASPFLARIRDERTMSVQWSTEDSLDARAAMLLEKLGQVTEGDTAKMLGYALPSGVSLVDEERYVNFNWLRPEFLRAPEVASLLRSGSVDDILAIRTNYPIARDTSRYASHFDRKDWQRLFSLDGPLNPNTVDERAFGNVMGQVAGSEESGTAWREKLRGLRLQNKRLATIGDAKAWFGSDWERVEAFVSVVPDWNVNTIDPLLLKAILDSSIFGLKESERIFSQIISARSMRYLADGDLQGILKVPKDHRIWSYLGCASTYWKLKITDEAGDSLSIAFRLNQSMGRKQVFQVLSRRYQHGPKS